MKVKKGTITCRCNQFFSFMTAKITGEMVDTPSGQQEYMPPHVNCPACGLPHNVTNFPTIDFKEKNFDKDVSVEDSEDLSNLQDDIDAAIQNIEMVEKELREEI